MLAAGDLLRLIGSNLSGRRSYSHCNCIKPLLLDSVLIGILEGLRLNAVVIVFEVDVSFWFDIRIGITAIIFWDSATISRVR